LHLNEWNCLVMINDNDDYDDVVDNDDNDGDISLSHFKRPKRSSTKNR